MNESNNVRTQPYTLEPSFYKCPICGELHGKPLGQTKIRQITLCRKCKKFVKMELTKPNIWP